MPLLTGTGTGQGTGQATGRGTVSAPRRGGTGSRGAGRRGRRRAPKGLGALYDPLTILSGKDLQQAVAALVHGQVAPLIRGLDRQTRDTQAQAKTVHGRVSNYYKQLAEQEHAGMLQATAITDRLNSRLGSISSGAQAATQQAGDQAQQAVAEDASARGAGLDAGAAQRLAEETALQRSDAARAGQTYQTSGALEGSNHEQLINALTGATVAQGGERAADVAKTFASRLADIGNRKSDVLASRGDLTTKLLLQLRDTGFQQWATKKGLSQKAASAALSAASAAARNATTRRGQNMTAAQRAADRRQRAAAARRRDATQRRGQNRGGKGGKGGKGSKGPTYAQQQKVITNVQNAFTTIRRLQQTPNANSSEIRQLLESGKADGRHYDHWIVNAAYDLYAFGRLGAQNLAELKSRGIKVPKGWRHAGHGASRTAKVALSAVPVTG